MARSLAGTRIRERRRALGVRQLALAEAAGISPSYLNLIEHNKRNAKDRILGTLAAILDLPVEMLKEGAESTLVSELRDAAASHAAQKPETDRVEEFVGRFPGWSRVLTAQARQMRDHAATVAALTDRLNYDPHLQETLHEMLTTITAIRSTSNILVSETDLPTDQLGRFQNTIYAESLRLSEAATELVEYFDRVDDTPAQASTPLEAHEQFMERHAHHFPTLDENPSEEIVEQIIANEPLLDSEEAQARARKRLISYSNDARAMPLERFHDVARRNSYAPQVLADTFAQPLLAVFRRLSTLARKGFDAPRFGLVIINAAGHPLYRRPLPEFSLPRFASICALWPVFRALSAPLQPTQTVLIMPNGAEFLARSVAAPLGAARFGETPNYSAGMLVTSINDALSFGMLDRGSARTGRPVGTSCRLCQRSECPARSEPSILPALTR